MSRGGGSCLPAAIAGLIWGWGGPAMAEVSALDSELVEEFQFVEQIRSVFKTAGVTLVFWEAYCLVQNNRAALRRVADRPSDAIPVDLLESLRILRDRGGPVISKLRRSY